MARAGHYCVLAFLMFSSTPAIAQENGDTLVTEITAAPKLKPVKNTFESIWLIDNQTVMVPVKGTFEMDFQHRFGTLKNGYNDFFGLFASSNIRLGFNYVPINNLNIGLGITKYKMTWDLNAKYLILPQTKNGGSPVSVAYYGNIGIDTRPSDNFVYESDRLTYFNQLIVARKFSEKLSAQVAPSISHTNFVEGYYSEPGKISQVRKHDHIAIAVGGRYKLTEKMAVLVNYDQPITKHKSGNPHPNIAFGLEVSTSSHAFQFFAGNYYALSPQLNNMYNQYDYTDGQFLIGFNITRLWNY